MKSTFIYTIKTMIIKQDISEIFMRFRNSTLKKILQCNKYIYLSNAKYS